jgi:hypothetical protein
MAVEGLGRESGIAAAVVPLWGMDTIFLYDQQRLCPSLAIRGRRHCARAALRAMDVSY